MSDGSFIFKGSLFQKAVWDISLAIVTTACIALTVHTFFFYHFADVIAARIVSLLFLFVFCPFLFWGRIFIGDIHVDENGIGWWVWGRRWSYINWSDVRVMTIKTCIAYNQNPPIVTLYSLYRSDKTPQFNPLRFGDDLPNAKSLIDIVTQHIKIHNGRIVKLPTSRRAQMILDRSGLK